MRDIGQWLLHADQKELFEFLFAIILNILFLALVAGFLWPFGRLTMVLHLAKGFGMLWIVIFGVALLTHRVQYFFGVNLYDRAYAFVISNLIVSCGVQAGWAAFAALTVHSFIPNTTLWTTMILYAIGFFSCLVAFFVVSAFYQGYLYRLISLPLVLLSFLVFSVWPASGRTIYGWFFALF
jgi:hypothetical protein